MEPSVEEIKFQAQVACAVLKNDSTNILILSYKKFDEIDGVQHQSVRSASILQVDYTKIQAEAARQRRRTILPGQMIKKNKGRKKPDRGK
ncbi:hypothetical protein [Methylobacterium indicum]|uniref:Uncharacterized protein n=1 Tax=Methylobacterium indicum TaxID=1775910 RepID=A0A8H9C678_9HYPH|nr:hypothetical protein [Methylobacterium indicum]BCM85007.1 hypothetical protein mvi_34680 [Methylobacterium indicum]